MTALLPTLPLFFFTVKGGSMGGAGIFDGANALDIASSFLHKFL